MKYAALFATTLALLAAACGNGDGGGPQSPGPEGSDLASATPTATAAARCDGPLPPGPIALRGTVLSFEETPFGEPASEYEIARVEIEEIEIQQGVAEYGFKFEPGETAEVVLPGGDWPSARPGDCVLVSGATGRYACGAACDAAGFLAQVFEVYPVAPSLID